MFLTCLFRKSSKFNLNIQPEMGPLTLSIVHLRKESSSHNGLTTKKAIIAGSHG